MEYEGLTAEIIGAAMKVQQVLGPGMLEATYRSCLAYELRNRGHRVREEVGLSIHYEGLVISNAYRLDLLVDECAVIELKALEKLLPVHEAQLATYMRFAAKPVGLLLNFWAWPLKQGGIKRIVWNPPAVPSSQPQSPASQPTLPP